MTTYGDPGFVTHIAMGQLTALLVYHLSTDEIIPMNTTTYTHDLGTYLEELQSVVEESECCSTLDLSPIEDAIATLLAPLVARGSVVVVRADHTLDPERLAAIAATERVTHSAGTDIAGAIRFI